MPFKGKWMVRDVLARCPDLTHHASASMLHTLAMFAEDEAERAELELLGGHSPEGKVSRQHPLPPLPRTQLVVDPLMMSDRVAVAQELYVTKIQSFMEVLAQMFPSEIHLCVAVVRYAKPDGRSHDGVASTYLQATSPGTKRESHIPQRQSLLALSSYLCTFGSVHCVCLSKSQPSTPRSVASSTSLQPDTGVYALPWLLPLNAYSLFNGCFKSLFPNSPAVGTAFSPSTPGFPLVSPEPQHRVRMLPPSSPSCCPQIHIRSLFSRSCCVDSLVHTSVHAGAYICF